MSDKVNIFSSSDITREALAAHPLALVDFWATWCGPCRMVAPIVEALAEEVPDVTFGKVDIDQNADAAIELGIQAIPTLILFKNGEPVERVVGVQPQMKDALKALIEKHR